jgi:histone H3/H4
MLFIPLEGIYFIIWVGVKMAELPLAPVERIMRHSGADRVSLDAVKMASNEAEVLIKRLTEAALRIAHGDGRVTVTERDVALASKGVRTAEPSPRPL